jgi:hypothetical protein
MKKRDYQCPVIKVIEADVQQPIASSNVSSMHPNS